MGTKRAPLSRDRILDAALKLADASGVEAITMRGLGDELGFEAMSLYRHVANKEDVLAGILDLVLAETAPPAPDGEWIAAIRASAVSVADALARHPWATGLLMTPAGVRPARVAFMDSLLGRLRTAGFSADETYHAYHVLDAHIFGFSLWHTNYTLRVAANPEAAAKAMQSIPFDEYPYLAEHRDRHLADGLHHDVNAFELGLDLILDGLAKLRGGARRNGDHQRRR